MNPRRHLKNPKRRPSRAQQASSDKKKRKKTHERKKVTLPFRTVGSTINAANSAPPTKKTVVHAHKEPFLPVLTPYQSPPVCVAIPTATHGPKDKFPPHSSTCRPTSRILERHAENNGRKRKNRGSVATIFGLEQDTQPRLSLQLLESGSTLLRKFVGTPFYRLPNQI